VDIAIARAEDVQDLARLLWVHAAPDEQEQQTVESFAMDLASWCVENEATHFAFVARVGGKVVGMAWVALVPRVPRPGVCARRSADIQSVFVFPEERGKGIGSRLVLAAVEHASSLGASRVTVHSGRRAIPVYERLGFASSRQLLQRPAE
jgi:GNAT superfamily N-acetyltransferase